MVRGESSSNVASAARPATAWIAAAATLSLIAPASANVFDIVLNPPEPRLTTEILFGGIIAAALLVALAVRTLSAWREAKRQTTTRDAVVSSALNSLGKGVVIVNSARKIMFCNDRYLKIYGLTRAELATITTGPELLELRRSRGMMNPTVDEIHASEQPDTTYVTDLPDGRSVLVRHRMLPDGGAVSTHEDCTDQVDLSRQLATTKQFLESIIYNSPVCIGAKNIVDGRYILVNRAFEKFAKKSRDEILGKRVEELFSPLTVAAITAADEAALHSADGLVREQINVESDGELRVIQMNRVVVKGHDGNPTVLLVMFDDITNHIELSRELERTKEFLELILDNIPLSLSVQHPDGRYAMLNLATESMLDCKRDGAIGLTPVEAFGERARIVQTRDAAALRKGGVIVEEYAFPTHNGPRMISTRRSTVLDDIGQPLYLIKTREDITDRREAERRMVWLVYHDVLTELPNRAAFDRIMTQLIDACDHLDESFAVLSVDLNGLKEVNDVFGYAVGDQLIVETARRIKAVVGGAEMARLGGGEFALLIDGEQPTAGLDLAKRIQQAMGDEFLIDGKSVRTTATIGVALFPRDGHNPTALLANSGIALLRAKAKSRGSIGVFEPRTDQQIRDRRALHQDLSVAIRNGELSLYYQPQAKTAPTISDVAVTGFEALARWHHPTRGFVPPGDFIPLAEQSGLIVEMGEWILREACREAAGWAKPLQIAVNLSPAQFLHGDLVGFVHSILLETGLSPDRLELEVTEGVLIEDFDRGLSLLRRLKGLGVRVSMDDFGSGYSSLTYLQAFPFDKIKIDRTFVMNLGRNPQSAAIIRAVIGLGSALQVSIIAEGVETADQLQFLADEGCDGIQGYYLGRPAPIASYSWILAGEKPPEAKVAERLAG
jgi:diguanylate cyclase (GGDEF)-like protein/PAS domain S-box-containing protein